jgi:hypothetical protein
MGDLGSFIALGHHQLAITRARAIITNFIYIYIILVLKEKLLNIRLLLGMIRPKYNTFVHILQVIF